MTPGSRIFGLDFMRALAVALVLFEHSCFVFVPIVHDLNLFEPYWMVGQIGVELFFVLSGFLIGGLLADQAANFDLRGFWLRRWLRTLPNYYLFVLVNLLIERWLSGAWPSIGAYLVFLQNFAWPVPTFFNESWSLAIEEIFYLIAPLALLAALRVPAVRARPVAALLVCVGLFTAVRLAFVLQLDPTWDEGVRKVALARLDAIAYGVLAVVLYRRYRPSLAAARVIAVAGAAVVGVCIASYLLAPRDGSVAMRTLWFNLISIGFASWLPLAALWRHSGLPALFELGVRKLALWSYALYVSHLALLRVLQGSLVWKDATWWQCLLLASAFAASAIAFAALVYRCYERPFLRLRNRVAPQAARAAAQPLG